MTELHNLVQSQREKYPSQDYDPIIHAFTAAANVLHWEAFGGSVDTKGLTHTAYHLLSAVPAHHKIKADRIALTSRWEVRNICSLLGELLGKPDDINGILFCVAAIGTLTDLGKTLPDYINQWQVDYIKEG